jgi:hypothetical protein
MRLYGISEADIVEAIASHEKVDREGDRTIAMKMFPGRFSGCQLKVIYLEGGERFIITAYPLKKSLRKEKK